MIVRRIVPTSGQYQELTTVVVSFGIDLLPEMVPLYGIIPIIREGWA